MQDATTAAEAAGSRSAHEADLAAVDDLSAQKKRRQEQLSAAKALTMSRRKFEQLMGDPVRKRAAKKKKPNKKKAKSDKSKCAFAVETGEGNASATRF